MVDHGMRRLERAGASGGVEDQARHLKALVRAGRVAPEDLRRAAELGDETASLLVEDASRCVTLAEVANRLASWGPLVTSVVLRAVFRRLAEHAAPGLPRLAVERALEVHGCAIDGRPLPTVQAADFAQLGATGDEVGLLAFIAARELNEERAAYCLRHAVKLLHGECFDPQARRLAALEMGGLVRAARAGGSWDRPIALALGLAQALPLPAGAGADDPRVAVVRALTRVRERWSQDSLEELQSAARAAGRAAPPPEALCPRCSEVPAGDQTFALAAACADAVLAESARDRTRAFSAACRALRDHHGHRLTRELLVGSATRWLLRTAPGQAA